MTKIIALLPFKNEERFLPAFMESIALVADKLIAIDDYSTDRSVEIINQKAEELNLDVEIRPALPGRIGDWSVDKTRQHLLELGRESGGTHFICLDADECFTKPLSSKLKKIIQNLEPGFKVQMQWLAMWKSVDHYRNDHSVWSNNFKDFIFADHPDYNFVTDAYFCEARTPGPNEDKNTLKLNPKYGAVMHFQFSDWQRFQLKQCWYRCRELAYGKPAPAINQKFRITLDDPNTFVEACPVGWMPDHELPVVDGNSKIDNWHLQEIKSLFNQHGKDFFKDLDIWHVKEIKEL